MKPDIILHVGTEKTGSTSIQHLLSRSRELLLGAGVLFPSSIGSPCHIKLTACALENERENPIRKLLGLQEQERFFDFVQETKTYLKTEIEEANPATIILSDEHINVHLSNPESLLAFKDLVQEFGNIKSVIIYLRRQDELEISVFSEAVKLRALAGIDLNDILPIYKKLPYRLNYLDILNNLSSVFGEEVIVPRVYDIDQFPDGDICEDFICAAGIRLYKMPHEKLEQNISIDGRVIRRLAQIALSVNGIKSDRGAKQYDLILENCMKIFTGPGIALERKIHERFMSQFLVNNKIIAAKYFRHRQVDHFLFNDEISSKGNDKPIYPACTMSWPEFFIQYYSCTTFDNASAGILKKLNDVSLKD